MIFSTRLTKTLKIKYPIIQGPFGGGYSSVELTAKVSNLGGLGSFGAVTLSPTEISETNYAIRSSTNRPYAINLWISDKDELADTYGVRDFAKVRKLFKPYFKSLKAVGPTMPKEILSKYEEQVQTVLDLRPPVFSFIYGIPSKKILRECKRWKIKTIGTATTVDEAIALERAGVDVVVASGFEAGGHRVSFLRSAEDSMIGTFSLTPQIADKIRTPFVAAGGIADGRGIAAAFALGADGVQIGTAFLACKESNASDVHRNKILSSKSLRTSFTKIFTGRLARGITTEIMEDLREHEGAMAPYPIQRSLVNCLNRAAAKKNNTDYLPYWAGQSSPLLTHRNTEKLFHDLIKETEKLLLKIN
jgi:nitronate monooxygenase